jgi:hypothetical protein
MGYKMQPTIMFLIYIHICKGYLELDADKLSLLKIELALKISSKLNIFSTYLQFKNNRQKIHLNLE